MYLDASSNSRLEAADGGAVGLAGAVIVEWSFPA
jgi:hypothetical protein